jgi:hypothetical protein
VAGDSIALLNWLKDWPYQSERQDLVQRAIALSKALRDYQIPAYIVEGASEQALRLIFKRANTSGVAMQESDVFEALFGGGARRPIESACDRLEADTGFGRIKPNLFLSCLKVVEGLNVRRSLTAHKGEAEDVAPGAVERTESALRRATEFLSGDAGIPHAKLLPYRLPLLVLARFFHRHPEPSARTRVLLVRWVWRGALSGVHTNSNDATVFDLQSKLDGQEFDSVERLLETVPRSFQPLRAQTTWNGGSAATRLCAVAMAHMGPRDPQTGEVFEQSQLRLALDTKGEAGQVYVGVHKGETSIAQRLLVPDRRALRILADAPGDVLASHGMDAEAAGALGRGDHEGFAAARAKILDAWFERFFTERSAPEESDRPAISELVRRVEAQAAGS